MFAKPKWKVLGWRHSVWELVRYYLSMRSSSKKEKWLAGLKSDKTMSVNSDHILPIPARDVSLFLEYIEEREEEFQKAFNFLRNEEEALDYCRRSGIAVGTTTTQSKDHHQSSKALIAAVSTIASKVASNFGLSINPNPQTRCVWCTQNIFHVTARNLDGAIPGLVNPSVIWEIKEYWGKTSGGSKMSDAVYESNLVGLELRDFEERCEITVTHVVFVDGKEQWKKRKSDLRRFLDLMNQGIIDYLFIGKEVETEWEAILSKLLE